MEPPGKITNQGVAVFCIASSVLSTFVAFFLSRSDHDLKLMSLQAVLTLGGGLVGIAGTLLVGAPAYKSIADRAPSGSRLQESTTIQMPPIPPEDSVTDPKA